MRFLVEKGYNPYNPYNGTQLYTWTWISAAHWGLDVAWIHRNHSEALLKH